MSSTSIVNTVWRPKRSAASPRCPTGLVWRPTADPTSSPVRTGSVVVGSCPTPTHSDELLRFLFFLQPCADLLEQTMICCSKVVGRSTNAGWRMQALFYCSLYCSIYYGHALPPYSREQRCSAIQINVSFSPLPIAVAHRVDGRNQHLVLLGANSRIAQAKNKQIGACPCAQATRSMRTRHGLPISERTVRCNWQQAGRACSINYGHVITFQATVHRTKSHATALLC